MDGWKRNRSSLPGCQGPSLPISTGCLAERKLPTRYGHAIMRRLHADLDDCLRRFMMAVQAEAEGDTASNQYMMADVGCHILCFRAHATDPTGYKLSDAIFTLRGSVNQRTKDIGTSQATTL
jgi:hypothetical protein